MKPALFLIALFAAPMWFLAQAPAAGNGTAPAVAKDTTPWGAIGAAVGAMGGGGFSIWYGWYMTVRVLPERDKRFAEIVSARDAMFAAALEKRDEKLDAIILRLVEENRAERDIFRGELKAERESREQMTARFSAEVDRLLSFYERRSE